MNMLAILAGFAAGQLVNAFERVVDGIITVQDIVAQRSAPPVWVLERDLLASPLYAPARRSEGADLERLEALYEAGDCLLDHRNCPGWHQ